MPSLTLKDVPPELLERIRVAAARDRRSLVQEILILVAEQLDRREPDDDRAARRVATWRRVAGAWRSDEPLDEEIAAVLDSRTPGRDIAL